MNGKMEKGSAWGRIACAVLLASLAMGPAFAESAVTLSVEQGANWLHDTRIMFVPMTTMPQYAAWIETADGVYVDTLVVTGSAAKGKWKGNPKGGRPEALPVWSHAASEKNVDAITSATVDADGGLGASGAGLVPGNEYVVRFEVNHSFDYNDSWTKKAKEGRPTYSGVNGQPSLVYEARFTAGSAAMGKVATISLVPVGHGTVDGRDGTIVRDLAGFTTALAIIKEVSVDILDN